MKLHDPSFTEIISVLEEKAMPNPFCHVELNTTDVEKAKTFYGKLFNWKLQDMDSPGVGGTVIKDVTPVPNFGEFSIITDPTGAHFALWHPKKK
jgi:uncharacterized protein